MGELKVEGKQCFRPETFQSCFVKKSRLHRFVRLASNLKDLVLAHLEKVCVNIKKRAD